MLASDDVRHGALAISLARRTKYEARTALVLALAPGVAFALGGRFRSIARRLRAARGAIRRSGLGTPCPGDGPRPRHGFALGRGGDDFRAAELAAHG